MTSLEVKPRSRTRRIVAAASVLAFAVCTDATVQNFITFGARSKASECRSQLRSLYAEARALDEGAPLSFDSISTEVGHGARYAYIIGVDGPRTSGARGAKPVPRAVYLAPDTSKHPQVRTWEPRFPLPSGVTPGKSDAGLVLACAGDIDTDPGFDLWSVADFDRELCDERIPAGKPWNEVRDIPRYRNPVTRLLWDVPDDEVACER